MKEYIRREIYSKKIKPYIGKEIIKVLTGQRRTGKSYLLYQTMDDIKIQYAEAPILYINMELMEFSHIKSFQDLYNYIKKNSVDGTLNFVMIDEIQQVEGFEHALRSLLAEGGYDIYCTGSNAKLLSGELGTYLSGRYIEIAVFSLSFIEFTEFHKLPLDTESLNKYLKYGGLPYLKHLSLEDDIVFDYLSNITQSILFRDVVQRFNIRNIDFLTRLVQYLAKETGNIISATSISKYLKSQQISNSLNATINYLKHLTTSLLVSEAKRINLRGKKVFEIGEKFYFNDVGIRNSIAGYSPFDLGQILENIVFLHLRIQGFEVYIGQKDGKEIDFVASKGGDSVYFQVALRIDEKKTMEREFGNLLYIKDNYRKYVITLDDFTGAGYQGIEHLPLLKFLTEFQDI